MSPKSNLTPEQRFWAKVDKSEPDGCWLWTASLDREGYGRFGDSHNPLAHRYVYELCVAPIPPGFQIDHLCRTHNCVRPDHLELVTQLENVRRGMKGRLRTHCKNGHAYTPENLYTNKHGHRICRTCVLAAQRRYKARRRA